jgi:hypothetical protein
MSLKEQMLEALKAKLKTTLPAGSKEMLPKGTEDPLEAPGAIDTAKIKKSYSNFGKTGETVKEDLDESAVASILTPEGRKKFLAQQGDHTYHTMLRTKEDGVLGVRHETGKSIKGEKHPEKSWFVKEENELDESKDSIHQVYVNHNYYAGKYYNHGGRAYPVLASSPEEAHSIAKTHKDKIESDLRSKKVMGRNLISKNDKYHLKDGDIHSPKAKSLWGNSHNHVLNRHGEFVAHGNQNENIDEAKIDWAADFDAVKKDLAKDS